MASVVVLAVALSLQVCEASTSRHHVGKRHWESFRVPVIRPNSSQLNLLQTSQGTTQRGTEAGRGDEPVAGSFLEPDQSALSEQLSAPSHPVSLVSMQQGANQVVDEAISFSEWDFQTIAALHSDRAMTVFIKAVLRGEHRFVPPEHEQDLAEFAHGYSGAEETRTLEQLQAELAEQPWVRSASASFIENGWHAEVRSATLLRNGWHADQIAGDAAARDTSHKEFDGASFTESEYQEVAARHDDDAMREFVHAMLKAEHRFIPQKHEEELSGFVQWYSGSKAIQTLERLRAELARKPWVHSVKQEALAKRAHAEIKETGGAAQRTIHEDFGARAALSRENFQSVLDSHDAAQIEMFVRKIIAKYNATVTDEAELSGMISYYVENIGGNATYAELMRELTSASWLYDFHAASKASLDEEGYQYVADLENDDQMRAYIRRVIALHGGVAAEGQSEVVPGKIVCHGCRHVYNMAPRFSGTMRRQSYKALVSELLTRSWIANMSDAPVARLEDNKARLDYASTRCDECAADSLLFIGVYSAPSNWKRRDDVRRSWMQDSVLQGHRPLVQAKFIIGQVDDESLNFDIEEEKRMYGDIERLPVPDSYENLPSKSIAFFRWFAGKYCCNDKLPKYEYVMKLDDDSWPNLQTILPRLNQIRKLSPMSYIGGFLWNGPVQREGKWAETANESEFGLETYPAYAAGSGYILSMDLARKLDESVDSTGVLKLRNEDTTIGNWIREGNAFTMMVNYYDIPYSQYGCQDEVMLAMNLCTGALRCMWEKRLLGLVQGPDKNLDMCCVDPWKYGMERVQC